MIDALASELRQVEGLTSDLMEADVLGWSISESSPVVDEDVIRDEESGIRVG